jgi:hypothetical protein
MNMKRSGWLATVVLVMGVGVRAWTQAPDAIAAASATAVAQARGYFLQAREGHFDVVPEALRLIEAAVATDPENPSLLYAQAFALNLQGVAAADRSGNLMDTFASGQRAFPVIQRARRLAPDNPEIVSLYGGMLAATGMMQQRTDWTQAALAEISRAVQLGPTMVAPRLIRQQMGLFAPPATRDTPALIDDMTLLAAAGEGGRSGDMEHLLLADLYAEIGKADEARREYRAAARRPASALKEVVQSRLVALEQGGVPLSVITRQRMDSQTKCVNCHAR